MNDLPAPDVDTDNISLVAQLLRERDSPRVTTEDADAVLALGASSRVPTPVQVQADQARNTASQAQ